MKRQAVIVIVIILFALGAWQAYRFFYRAPQSPEHAEAAATLDAKTLLQTFQKDSAAANRLYLGKVIAVTGEVKELELSEDDNTIILKTDEPLSSVRCSLDSTQNAAAAQFKAGSRITIKGNCSGFTADELLGADVILNRCVIINNKQ